MAIQQLRTSQLITTFGTGAMVDLPGDSVIIGGPDHWVYREEEIADHLIEERRLSKRVAEYLNNFFEYNLQDVDLRRPPRIGSLVQRQGMRAEVTAWRFPEWYVVQSIEAMKEDGRKRRRLVHKNLLTRGKYRDETTGKRLEVVPIRFVRACDRGHVDDINWYAYVHGADDGSCNKAQGGFFLVEQGSSGTLVDIHVACECGMSQSLATAQKDKKLLGYCSGRRPWLGPASKELCNHPSKLLVRSASNAYFSQLYSVISIPESGSGLQAVLRTFAADLEPVKSADMLKMARMFNTRLDRSLADYSDTKVMEVLSRMRGSTSGVPIDTKSLEFQAFIGPTNTLSEDTENTHFLIRLLDASLWKNDTRLAGCLERIVLVDRMREVVAQVGFTRFESRGKSLGGELDLDLKPAPLAKDKIKIIPAYENRGEGIFLQFKPETIVEWRTQDAVRKRADVLVSGFDLKSEERGQERSHFHGVPFYMLHTLAHLLIQEIALECGYPVSSLKERVYCAPTVDEYGILIYTGSSDAEGTLGGLVDASKQICSIFNNMLQNAAICSADPVCSHTKPEKDNPSHWLLGSACHCCTHLPETSCEQMNQYLDRSLVVPTMEGLGCEFFPLNE